MSKFIFSNSFYLTSVKIRNVENGYKVSGCITDGNVKFLTFHKLKVKNQNFMKIGDDFIAITGTLIFDGLKDERLLERVYNEYIERGDSLRNDLRGNYAVIIKFGNKVIVFGEETYFYDIFYYYKDGSFLVSNDLYEIYQSVDSLEVDVHNVLEQSYLNCVIGNETVLKGVNRLSGDQKIVIDLESSSLDVIPVQVDWNRLDVDCEQATSLLSKNLTDVADSISSTYNSTSICMTGGLDSRMSLAALLSVGSKPSLYYGEGNSPITNTHHQDYDICRIFSLKYNLPITKMDWSNPSPIDNDWNICLKKFGILYHAYAGSNTLLKGLQEIKEEFVTFGQVGELFRTLDFTENRTRFTIEDYVDEYYFQKNDAGKYIAQVCVDFDAFRTRLIKKYKGVCKRYNLDPNNMVVEDFFYLNLEYRANADNVMLNLTNRMRYCSWLLSALPVMKMANIAVKYLKNSHYMLMTLEALYPSCLDVPVFSHQHEMVFDKKLKKLVWPTKKRIRKLLTSFVPLGIKLFIAKKISRKKEECSLFLSKNLIEACNKNDLTKMRMEDIDRNDIALLQYFYAFHILNI